MFETVMFFVFLGLTVLGIVSTLFLGLKKRRRAHLTSAVSTTVLLVITVVFALMLGKVRDFPPDEMAFHKIFSHASAYSLLAVAITGMGLWRAPSWRWLHRICIAVFLLSALTATCTGLWVFSLSTPVELPGLP